MILSINQPQCGENSPLKATLPLLGFGGTLRARVFKSAESFNDRQLRKVCNVSWKSTGTRSKYVQRNGEEGSTRKHMAKFNSRDEGPSGRLRCTALPMRLNQLSSAPRARLQTATSACACCNCTRLHAYLETSRSLCCCHKVEVKRAHKMRTHYKQQQFACFSMQSPPSLLTHLISVDSRSSCRIDPFTQRGL